MTTRTMQTIEERQAFDVGVKPQTTGDGNATGDWYSMQDYRRVAAVATSDEMSNGSKLTVQLRQATDDQGSGAKDLGTAVTATSENSAEVLQAIQEAQVEEMDVNNGFTHVAVQVTTDEASVNSQAVLVRADGRFRS